MATNGEETERLRTRLQRPGAKCVIIPHISPDGDAAGSCSACMEALTRAGFECHILTCDFFPEDMRWMKHIKESISNEKHPKMCARLIAEADLIFMLDHNSTQREGKLEPLVAAAKAEKVMIDHHIDPSPADYRISDVRVSSTCELLYTVITAIWGKEFVNVDMANSLYAGINTDTGGFSHNSSRPQTYRIVADLLERGMDKEWVHRNLFQMNRLCRLRLNGYALLNKLTVHPDYPLAIIPITLDELNRYDFRDGDLEGLVNVPLSVANIDVSVQITQRKERVKLSFRSKGTIPVNEWAKAYFGGGGHLNAAGGQVDNTDIEAVVKQVYDTAEWFFATHQTSKV